MTLEHLAQHRGAIVLAYWCWLAVCGIAGGCTVAALIHHLRPRRAA